MHVRYKDENAKRIMLFHKFLVGLPRIFGNYCGFMYAMYALKSNL